MEFTPLSSSAPANFVAIGDSITQGAPYVPSEYTFPKIFEKLTGIRVINLGIAGLTVAEMEMNFESDVIMHQPEVVIIIGGGNDIDYGRGYDDIISDLSSMYGMAASRGIRVVMGTLTPSDMDGGPETLRMLVNEWVRGQVSKDKVLADIDLALRDPSDGRMLLPEFDSGDRVHPNAKGMTIVAKAIQSALAANDGPIRQS